MMISQADIIRTLVNKNCTDESIMSTALSPDCTPPKLMEKFAEAERFDLALDVSMKLGLDVLPLWKTWAMRCLKNRNFQGAREKFRHCFLRLRVPGGRQSPAASALLSDILKTLTRMEETKINLSDEIECIKQRKSRLLTVYQQLPSDNHSEKEEQGNSLVIFKPKIYAECLHYLQEYANAEDKIKFYIRNSLWEEATTILLDNRNQINADKFFITEILMYLTSTGCLDKFLSAFIKSDPEITLSLNYFKAIYNFCMIHRRYNLLYYIQVTIGDYVAAAKNQITHCFLKKPMLTYKELNDRLTSLTNASKNYQDYIKKLEQQVHECSRSLVTTTTTTTTVATITSIDSSNKLQEQHTANNNLFSQLPLDEVQKQLRTIELQIDITRNFAINEVSGCMNGIEVVVDNGGLGGIDEPAEIKETESSSSSSSVLNIEQRSSDNSPVTLFDKCEHRKTFLAALVLIYFDLTCSTNFSRNGLDLANNLIDTYRLDKLKVFKTAMRIIIDDESCEIIENAKLLLDRLREDFMAKYVRSSPLKRLTPQRLVPKKGSPVSTPAVVASSSSTPSIDMQGGGGGGVLRKPADYYSEIIRRLAQKQQNFSLLSKKQLDTSANKSNPSNRNSNSKTTTTTTTTTTTMNANEAARMICDEVIRDSIGSCREPDYKMELAKLLSGEAKIELYIELGKLSNAQRLAFNMNRPDYVSIIIEEAARLNQNHVKTVCQLWLAKRS